MSRAGVIEPLLSQSRRDRMATGETSGPIHPVATRRSGHRYLFYVKHHGGGDAAKWLQELTPDDEFTIFDTADFHDLSCERGWLYGVRNGLGGEVLALGTDRQQIAEFPHARSNEPWHGYPVWPLKEEGPENRKGEKFRPAPVVFKNMEKTGLITTQERMRLMKGNYA